MMTKKRSRKVLLNWNFSYWSLFPEKTRSDGRNILHACKRKMLSRKRSRIFLLNWNVILAAGWLWSRGISPVSRQKGKERNQHWLNSQTGPQSICRLKNQLYLTCICRCVSRKPSLTGEVNWNLPHKWVLSWGSISVHFCAELGCLLEGKGQTGYLQAK